MKIKATLFLLGLCLSFYAHAQSNLPKVVIGAEGGLTILDIFPKPAQDPIHSRANNFFYGFSVEVPINKFSVGVGFNQYAFGSMASYQYAYAEYKNEKLWRDVYLRETIDLEAWGLPVRIIYRLPCNCVYFQFGMGPLFLDPVKQRDRYVAFEHNQEAPYSPTPTYQLDNISNLNWIMEFGIGYKLHLSDRFRVSIKPGYWKILNPMMAAASYRASQDFFNLSFGAQYGLF